MPIRLLTFDVYSALLDIGGGLGPAVAALWPEREAQERRAFIREWRRLQLEYTLISTLLGRGHLSFRTVTRRALDVALQRLQWTASPDERERLVEAWDHLPPWPEAPEVLAQLRQGPWPLALLSNGDAAMLRAVAQGLGIAFDAIFSAEQAGVYKPHPAIYRLPCTHLNLHPADIVHVAGSGRDVMGAKAAGLRCVWINRTGDRVFDPAYAADVELPDLRELPDVLARWTAAGS